MPSLRGTPNAFTTGSVASTTLSVTKEAGTASGDMIFMWCVCGVAGQTFSCPGFSSKPAVSGTNGSAQLLYRQADGTEGASFTVTASSSRLFGAIRGTVIGPTALSFLFDPVPSASGQVNANSTTVTVAGVTTTQNGDLLIWLGFDVGVGGATPQAITLPAGGGGITWASAFAQVNSTAGGLPNVGARMATATQATAGTTGSQNGSLGSAQPSGGMLLSIPAGVKLVALADSGSGTDTPSVLATAPMTDSGSGFDFALGSQFSTAVPLADGGSGTDYLNVLKSTAPFVLPTVTRPPAATAIVRSRMPRMHLQNLFTGQWVHRDVQGVTSPSITWSLNTPDSFTCTFSPPRADLMDATGNPLLVEWQTACYLEEGDEIKFGGILVGSTFEGPNWGTTWMGFMGYPTGQPYTGVIYRQIDIEALDVVRFLWDWLQDQTNGDLGLVLDQSSTGILLGHFRPPGASTVLTSGNLISNGQNIIGVKSTDGFSAGGMIRLAANTPRSQDIKVKSIRSSTQLVTSGGIGPRIQIGDSVDVLNPKTPYSLHWWDDKDVGSEIAQIQGEAVFDTWEQHTWTDSSRTAVRHRLHFGIPRVGRRHENLRFAEGENIVQFPQMKRDGTEYANHIIGHGAGQGSSQIRSTVSVNDKRLRRAVVYMDQTAQTHTRITSRAQRQLNARMNFDTVSQIAVIDHANAPFGSFSVGDDIAVRLSQGWRRGTIWSRITQIQQDPTTSLMTLTLARSDSFSYSPESGVEGTL